MSAELSVTVSDLRAAVGVLLDEAERRFGPVIDLDADHYWDLDLRIAYDVAQVPTDQPVAGQLSEDVASVRSLLDKRSDSQVVLWHDLAHIVGILRRVAALDLPTPS